MPRLGFPRLAGTAPDAGAIETGAGPLADTDADGIPDIWERLHGLNPNDPADASSDSDADGQNARAEFGSSTDPGDRQSVHRMDEVIVSPMSVYEPYPRWGYLTWTRYPAVFYYVEESNDLRNWRRLPDAALPDGSTIWWSLGLIEANSPSTFYRRCRGEVREERVLIVASHARLAGYATRHFSYCSDTSPQKTQAIYAYYLPNTTLAPRREIAGWKRLCVRLPEIMNDWMWTGNPPSKLNPSRQSYLKCLRDEPI